MLEIGEANEALGVAALPECARGIELDVAAYGFELARIERKLDIRRALEEGCGGLWRRGMGGKDGGSGAPEPRLWQRR